jgi:hypothetical protein
MRLCWEEETKKVGRVGEVYLAHPPLGDDYHYREQTLDPSFSISLSIS